MVFDRPCAPAYTVAVSQWLTVSGCEPVTSNDQQTSDITNQQSMNIFDAAQKSVQRR